MDPKTPDTATDSSATPDTVVAAAIPAVADPVSSRLAELGVTSDMIVKIKGLGADIVEDLAEIQVEDLTALGMKPIPAKKLVAAFNKVTPAATTASAAPGAFGAMPFDDILPSVPSEESWLAALKTGGVLKVDQSTVISAVRAALGQRVGLFSALDKIVERMEQFSDANEEPVSPEFFKLRRELTRKSYGDIFDAIPGLDGTYVTEGRKKQLFQRIDSIFWPAVIGFHGQLKSWQEAWVQGSANPAMMMNAFMMAAGGGGGVMPPGMMAPPETGVLRDNADAVADAVNKVFAGSGAQIAAAIGYDASRIKTVLDNSMLPALTGFANRDQMIRQLGLAVNATYPRMEKNLTRFVLGVLQVKDQPDGPEGLRYFGGLFMLGAQIPWDQLSNESPRRPLSGIGGTGRRDRDL